MHHRSRISCRRSDQAPSLAIGSIDRQCQRTQARGGWRRHTREGCVSFAGQSTQIDYRHLPGGLHELFARSGDEISVEMRGYSPSSVVVSFAAGLWILPRNPAGQLRGGLHGVSVLDGHVVENPPPSGRHSTKSRSLPFCGCYSTLSFPAFLRTSALHSRAPKNAAAMAPYFAFPRKKYHDFFPLIFNHSCNFFFPFSTALPFILVYSCNSVMLL